MGIPRCGFFFFFNDTATTEIYTLSLHDALPILRRDSAPPPELQPPVPVRILRAPNRRWLDRKSTRLNSSHLVISYAVFCLEEQVSRIAAFATACVGPLSRDLPHVPKLTCLTSAL